MERHEVIHARGEALVHFPGIRVEPVVGLPGACERLAEVEIGADAVRPEGPGHFTASADQPPDYATAVVLHLDVPQRKSGGPEILGEDVWDAERRTADLRLLGQGLLRRRGDGRSTRRHDGERGDPGHPSPHEKGRVGHAKGRVRHEAE